MEQGTTGGSARKGRRPTLFVEIDQRIGRGVVIETGLTIQRADRASGLRAARLLCDCGNEYVSSLQALVGKRAENQRCLSCGCLRLERQIAAVSGKNHWKWQRGDLSAPVRQRPLKNVPQGEAPACKCGCGELTTWNSRKNHWNAYVTGHYRTRGSSASWVDRRYGKLTVIEYAGAGEKLPGRERHLWLCRCDCGKEIVLSADSLRRPGRRKRGAMSCGCSRRKPMAGRRKPEDVGIPWKPARNKVLGQYKRNARVHDRAWDLTGEDFDRLTSLPCFYCGSPPSSVYRSGRYEGNEFVYSGIDRVDNALGYVVGNVVPCCTICNNAKKDLSLADFTAWIARLTEYHFFHPEVMPSHLLKGGA